MKEIKTAAKRARALRNARVKHGWNAHTLLAEGNGVGRRGRMGKGGEVAEEGGFADGARAAEKGRGEN